MKKIIKTIIFFIILIFIFYILTCIFVPRELENMTMKKFYDEPINTIDVIALGSSTIRSGYSPITIYQKYGITSYALGTSNQTFGLSYYMLLESLKYQNPRVVIIDFDNVFVEDQESAYRKMLNSLKFDDVKIKAINDENLYNVSENKLNYIFPFFRYHDRYKDFKEEDFYKMSKNKNYDRVIKGNMVSVYIDPYIDNNNYMKIDSKEETISDENMFYLKQIIQLCKQKNIQMLWTAIPSSSWSLSKSKVIKKLADEYEIEFIDYNLESEKNSIKLDWKKDTSDKGIHLNSNGAEKVSLDIGKILMNNYNIKSRKKDKNIDNNWNNELKNYKKVKRNLEKQLYNK